MTHPEKKLARRYDTPGRCAEFTDLVYRDSGVTGADLKRAEQRFVPRPNAYNAYIGELHGHSTLSDGGVDIDTYFRNLRSRGIDFGALTDHDHGGVGRPTLWSGDPSKWELINRKAAEYDEPGKFTVIPAYERDSYPFYNNLVVYYGTRNGEMIRGSRDGEFTADELRQALARDDVILVPHDTYMFSAGVDFRRIPADLFTPLIELYSIADAAEYMGNPAFDANSACEGGFWQDALRRGAKMGCIGGSDNHSGTGATLLDAPYPHNYQGLTGIWAKGNTLPDLFSALKARRCYAFMGGRMVIDFRIGGHFMGEEFSASPDEELAIWYSVEADCAVKKVTLVKNLRDYIMLKGNPRQLIFDYDRETAEDCYYLRVELTDGRFGWTSPVWVRS